MSLGLVGEPALAEIGRQVQDWGRRPLLLGAFGALPARLVLLLLVPKPALVIAPTIKPDTVVLSEAPRPEAVPTKPWARLNRPVRPVRSAMINGCRTPSTVPLMPFRP
jgi:hypothetical protein